MGTLLTITTFLKERQLVLCNPCLMVVILGVLTGREFFFSLFVSQLLAKAIPVRGTILEKPAQGNLSGLFAFGN
ncbi:hypothetical protein [Photorhabdus sp. SF281]|uniref:hypothetical protein n=1 Tax=Photorhabdus sp. SF281 TaxID=3459527 RepID=UPI0040441114